MYIINIIPAVTPKKALSYDHEKDELIIEKADIVALVELQNPDNLQEAATVPMYMCCDSFGVYFSPQLSINFLEFVDTHEDVDFGKYIEQIKEIKDFYIKVKNKTDFETIEVEKRGNLTQIKRIIRSKKIEEPKYDS